VAVGRPEIVVESGQLVWWGRPDPDLTPFGPTHPNIVDYQPGNPRQAVTHTVVRQQSETTSRATRSRASHVSEALPASPAGRCS